MKTASPRSRAAPRSIAFWLVAYLFATTMLGTTLPTPLYVLYQAKWHFSSGLVTVVFSSYAAGVLAALLLAGRTSDEIGRKPVLAGALGLSALSTVAFIFAPDLSWLFVGRVLSGLSAGLVTGTATAALTDLVPASSGRRASLVATSVNMGGLGLGPLMAGLCAEYGPHPTVLVFELYLALLVIAAVGLFAVPETVSPRRRLTLRFHGLGVPVIGRAEFLAAGLAGFAAFSLLGLFSSLAPTFLGSVLHEHNHAVGGAVVFLVFAVATATQLSLSRLGGRGVVQAGLAIFLVALVLIVAGLSAASMALFLAGSVVSGIAVGATFVASLATANRLAPAERRGQVVSTFFVLCYVGLTIPVIGVGVASQHVGYFRATLIAAIVLAGLALISIMTVQRGGSQNTPERLLSPRERRRAIH